jgi:hypothetical protein
MPVFPAMYSHFSRTSSLDIECWVLDIQFSELATRQARLTVAPDVAIRRVSPTPTHGSRPPQKDERNQASIQLSAKLTR